MILKALYKNNINASYKNINNKEKDNIYDLLLAFKTGLRRGELIGLRNCDIDLKKKLIYVNKSISPKIHSEDGGDIVDTALKTKNSQRVVPIDDELVMCLKNVKASNQEYVFFDDNTVDAYAARTAKILNKMADECNLPKITLHGIRHTFGTVLREQGVDIYSISKLMGHSSINVTAAIYVHNDVEVLRRAMGI